MLICASGLVWISDYLVIKLNLADGTLDYINHETAVIRDVITLTGRIIDQPGSSRLRLSLLGQPGDDKDLPSRATLSLKTDGSLDGGKTMIAEMILIGRDSERVGELCGESNVLAFRTLREFDLWRYERGVSALAPTIEPDVMAALREVQRPRADLEGPVRHAVEFLCSRNSTPNVEALIAASNVSEATFRRRWSESIPESPKLFLDRIRLLHARRLIEQFQVSRKEAAHKAGFDGVHHLRKSILARAERNAGAEPPF